jgi:hypothetical protein
MTTLLRSRWTTFAVMMLVFAVLAIAGGIVGADQGFAWLGEARLSTVPVKLCLLLLVMAFLVVGLVRKGSLGVRPFFAGIAVSSLASALPGVEGMTPIQLFMTLNVVLMIGGLGLASFEPTKPAGPGA